MNNGNGIVSFDEPDLMVPEVQRFVFVLFEVQTLHETAAAQRSQKHSQIFRSITLKCNEE